MNVNIHNLNMPTSFNLVLVISRQTVLHQRLLILIQILADFTINMNTSNRTKVVNNAPARQPKIWHQNISMPIYIVKSRCRLGTDGFECMFARNGCEITGRKRCQVFWISFEFFVVMRYITDKPEWEKIKFDRESKIWCWNWKKRNQSPLRLGMKFYW